MNNILAQALTIPGDIANNGQDNPVDLKYPKSFGDFESLFENLGAVISRAIPVVFAVAGVFMLIMIIMAGFTLLTSAGDAKKMEQGQRHLTYAILGFVVIFVAYWAVQLLGIVTGMDFSAIFP